MKAGDKLFAVTKYHGNHHVTIQRVGRKWAYPAKYERWKIDVATGVIFDGWWEVGRVYESEEAWNLKKAAEVAWYKFRHKVNSHADPVTIEAIQQAAEILGIDLSDER